jgi:DNA processing protein
MDDLAYRLAFACVSGIGAVRFRKLEEYFPDLEFAWKSPPAELTDAGMDQKDVAAILDARKQIDPGRELERLQRSGVQAFGWNDPAYPARLRDIQSPPPVLFVKGDLTEADDFAVAMVGTRRASPYGRQAAGLFAGELARRNITVVSGLAKGIDTVAHTSSLEAGGRTLAVLGSGLDVIYPAENTRLAAQVAESGALVSDFPLGTKPVATNFPWRNRLVAGLSRGTIVVEAGERSGAVITAGFALDQGRDVFAVPGSIFGQSSQGTNKLIQQGAAKLITRIEDVLDELQLGSAGQQLEMRMTLPEDSTEAALLSSLSNEPVHIDEICRAAGLPIAAVSASLTVLELKGAVRHLGGMFYALSR